MDLSSVLDVFSGSRLTLSLGVTPTTPATDSTPATAPAPDPAPEPDKYSDWANIGAGMIGGVGAMPLIPTQEQGQDIKETGEKSGGVVSNALHEIGEIIGPYLADILAVACGGLCIVLGGYALFSGGGAAAAADVGSDKEEEEKEE